MTSCLVGYQKNDNEIVCTRINADGYVDHTGKILLQKYNDDEIALELCERYEMRGFDEDGDYSYFIDSRESSILDYNDFMNRGGNEDYIYLYKNSEWFIYSKEKCKWFNLKSIYDKKERL